LTGDCSYFELICFSAKFVEKHAAQLRLSFPALQSFGCSSTPSLHRLVQVNMRDSTGKNFFVEAFMKNVLSKKSISKTDSFKAFLDSSRTLIAELNYKVDGEADDMLPSLFWIPTPKFKKCAITMPKISLLWKNTSEQFFLTASKSNNGKLELYTDSLGLKFEFLQFSSQLLEANFYKTSDHKTQACFHGSCDLLALWYNPHLDSSAQERTKIFMCMLPPQEFEKHGFKYVHDPDALVQRMKDESCFANFDKLNRDSFDSIGSTKLPQHNGESWEDFLKLSGDRAEVLLRQHIRSLTLGINEYITLMADKEKKGTFPDLVSHHEVFRMFWLYREDEASRTIAYQDTRYFVHRNSADKVRYAEPSISLQVLP
jgi:hypothetical protein